MLNVAGSLCVTCICSRVPSSTVHSSGEQLTMLSLLTWSLVMTGMCRCVCVCSWFYCDSPLWATILTQAQAQCIPSSATLRLKKLKYICEEHCPLYLTHSVIPGQHAASWQSTCQAHTGLRLSSRHCQRKPIIAERQNFMQIYVAKVLWLARCCGACL